MAEISHPDLPPGACKPYGGAWSGPVFVLTHHPPEDPEDPLLTFLTCSVPEAVRTAAQAAGGIPLGYDPEG